MSHVGPLGKKNLNFFVSIGITGIHDFLNIQFILKLPNSKPFHNTLNCASTANIEEVMKFYNLGDKTFETDFHYEDKLRKSNCFFRQSTDKIILKLIKFITRKHEVIHLHLNFVKACREQLQ